MITTEKQKEQILNEILKLESNLNKFKIMIELLDGPQFSSSDNNYLMTLGYCQMSLSKLYSLYLKID